MDTNRGDDTVGTDDANTTSRSVPGCGCWIAALVVLLLLSGAGAYFMSTIVLREETPLPGEIAIADFGLRNVAVPAEFHDMRIPGDLISDQNRAQTINNGKSLFQAQCALCHGQKGRGDAPLGQTQYPPALDLTSSRAQAPTNGQLFWLIAHGINFTGMPAWGKNYGGPNDDTEIWSMVAYLRALPNEK